MKPNSYSQENDPTYGVNKNRISNLAINALKNTQLDSSQNIPIAQSDHYFCRHGNGRRRYIKAQEVENLATNKYNQNHKGITYNDLLAVGLVSHKHQAQLRLKYCRNKNILFTPENHKPQQYYPTCLKSEILKAKLSKNMPVDPTGVSNHNTSKLLSLNDYSESVIIQTLEGYVLPLLPAAPLFIHNMHFKLKINPEIYDELKLPSWKRNYGKLQSDIIGNTGVEYVFYANGTVDVLTRSRSNPHKLENEIDRGRLLAFFGQVRGNLIHLLQDKHERIVPDLMEWELTECDINKDIKVSDSLHICGIKIQVKHLDHLFRIYIKSRGRDTVCRAEQSLDSSTRQSPIEVVNNIFNPSEKIENQIVNLDKKLDRLLYVNTNESNKKKGSNDFSDEIINEGAGD